jgi:hypothetical protein
VALPLYVVVNANGGEIVTFPGLMHNEVEFVSFLRSRQTKFLAFIEAQDLADKYLSQPSE